MSNDVSPGAWAQSISGGKWKMSAHLLQLDRALVRASYQPNQRITVEMPPRHGKQCAHSTPVLTPNGWMTHGDLRPGDQVFGIDGLPATILAIGKESMATMEVHFSSGETIRCHARHEWTVYDRSAGSWKTVETGYLVRRKLECGGPDRVRGHRYLMQLPRHDALVFPEQQLPIAPYVLGAWLGDGSRGKACLTHSPNDTDVAREVGKFHAISAVCVHPTTGVFTTFFRNNLWKALRLLGILNDKFIPSCYKYASVQQRLELLAGIIDTDGHVDRKGRVRIVGANQKLIEDVAEICRTLGWTAYVMSQAPHLTTSGIQGRQIIYTVGFNPSMEIPVILERKRISKIDAVRRRRAIIAIENCDPEPGRCIQIDRQDGLYLVGRGLHPTHNSTLASVYFPAWYRMKFPKRNLMLWSATGRLAQRFSTHARELCGLPLDDRTHSWEHWKIDGTGPNEGEFYSAGVGGGSTMGAGFHLGVIDDYFKDVEDALSEVQRTKLIEWYLTSCLTRAEPTASLVVVATRWHRDDLIGFIRANADELGEQWEHIRLPAINDNGAALWPEQWPIQALERKRKQYVLSGRHWMWDALYQQEPPEILDSEWDPHYFGKHIMFDAWPPMEETRFRIMTLDPSVGHNNKTDYSAITLASVTTSGHVYIEADIQRRDAERQVNEVLALAHGFGAQTIGIEYTGFQAVMQHMFARRCKEIGYYPLIHGIHTMKDKRMKIRAAVTPFLSRGFLKFKTHSPGTSLMLEQLRGFPTHKFDDGPDSLAMALELAAHVANFGLFEINDDQPVEMIGVE